MLSSVNTPFLLFRSGFFSPPLPVSLSRKAVFSIFLLILILGIPNVSAQNPEWITFTSENASIPSDRISSLAAYGSGHVWIGGRRPWLAYFNWHWWEMYDMDHSGLPLSEVTCLALGDSTNVWIGTWVGLYHFDGISWMHYDTLNSSIPDNEIVSLALNRKGEIWVGTLGGGIASYDGIEWTIYNSQNSDLPHNDVTALLVDSLDHVWMGTNGGGLARFSVGSWTVYNRANSELPNDHISALAMDRDQTLWIGFFVYGHYQVLTCFNGLEWKTYTLEGGVSSLAADTTGTIWVGTWDKGLIEFNGTTWTQYTPENSQIPAVKISCLAVDVFNNLWIGSYQEKGLTVFRKGSIVIPDCGMKGDVNNDGTINVLDVVRYWHLIVSLIPLTGEMVCRADCNFDGNINILDALCVVKVILGTGECEP